MLYRLSYMGLDLFPPALAIARRRCLLLCNAPVSGQAGDPLRGGVLERVMGIEPTLSAWKAEVLPLNYTRFAPVRTPAGEH